MMVGIGGLDGLSHVMVGIGGLDGLVVGIGGLDGLPRHVLVVVRGQAMVGGEASLPGV